MWWERLPCLCWSRRDGAAAAPPLSLPSPPASDACRPGWRRWRGAALRRSSVSSIAAPDAGGGSAGVVGGCSAGGAASLSARVGCPVASCSSTSPSGLKANYNDGQREARVDRTANTSTRRGTFPPRVRGEGRGVTISPRGTSSRTELTFRGKPEDGDLSASLGRHEPRSELRLLACNNDSCVSPVR